MTWLILEQHVLALICAAHTHLQLKYQEKLTKNSHLNCYLRVHFMSVCHTVSKNIVQHQNKLIFVCFV